MQMLTQQYTRLNVYDYVQNFCGWGTIAELLKYADTPTKELYLLALIKTGGRAGEILALTCENFTVDAENNVIYISGMPLFKRWRKVRQNGVTIRQHVQAVRKTFPILVAEPLSWGLLQYLNVADDGLLFRSSYKAHAAYTISWGCKFIRRLNNELPRLLLTKLGLPLWTLVTEDNRFDGSISSKAD